MTAEAKGASEKRHWVRLTRYCNQRCLFCLDRYAQTGGVLDLGFIRRDLARGRKRGLTRVVLIGGEPTVHPEFVKIVGLARELGYTHIQTITNGRRMCYPGFLSDAVAAGLREVTFSLHGNTPALHDRLTQVPGSFVQAVSALRAALALDPWRLEVRRELAAVLDGRALILEGRGRWDAARSLRRSSGELCPRPGSERTDLFRQWMRDGRFPEAFAEAEKILNEGPSLAEIRVLLIPWTREEAAQKGAAWLAALDGLKAPEPWLHLYRGTLRPGKSGLADLRRLDRWTGPRYGWMQFRAGQNFLCQGEFPEARRRLERALKFPPVDWRIRSFLAECLLCLGRPSDALAEIEQARDLAPREEVGEALAWRGAFKLWLGRYPEAREDLDWAHALGARHAAVWRAAARLKLGHKKEALALLDAAVRETPGDREAWVWRGEARRELGLRRGAREDLSREPVGAWALFNRALLCAAERNFPALRSDFDKIPEFMISHLKKKLGLPAAAPASDAARVKILEAGLSLAKGFRRDDYGYALWMH